MAAMDGLAAPEGIYVPTYSFLLPPPPAYPPPPSAAATLQGNAAKDGNVNGSSTSGSLGVSSGNNAASSSAAQAAGASGTGSNSSSAGNGGPAAEAGTTDRGAVNGDGNPLKTALQYISLQAPSAWSHVPIVPPSKISVASIRFPPGSSRRERQATQSSYLTASEVSDNSNNANKSDSSLSNPETNGLSASTSFDPTATAPLIGPVLEATLASQGIDGPASHVTGGPGGLPGMAALQLLAHLGGGPPVSTTANLTAGLALNSGNVTANKNLLKPKNNIKQTSSSFVQRLQNHSDYTKLLQPRPEGNLERFAFINRGRLLYWLGETSSGWLKDPLARLTFATTITSHDVNQLTRSPSRLDVAIAFSTSDIIWFEAISSRYSRLNKGGCVNDSPITNIRWVPGSETLILTTHTDGTCTIFDISREDSVSGSWTPNHGITLKRGENGVDGRSDERARAEVDMNMRNGSNLSPNRLAAAAFRPLMKPWDPSSCILVTRPAMQEAANEGPSGNKKTTWSKLNPVAHWRVARSCTITDVAFSPDHTKLAIVSTDGLLRIINLLTETLEGSFESYYGALNKVVFSPDARFILTAGCDDLISVWASDGRLLSRCPGHSSFVRGIAFDPWRWKVEDKTYRFASVGEDGKVFLWDFSSAALVRPKMPNSANLQRRTSQGGGSTFSLLQDQQFSRRASGGGGARRASMAPADGGDTSAIYVKALPRGEVAELQPVASFQIGGTGLGDQMQSIIPQSGTIPSAPNTSSLSTGGSSNAATNNSTTPSTSTTEKLNPLSNSSNDAGSANDLLVDVRFRPDGLLVMHKSGTLRFLQRPRHRIDSRFSTMDSSARSRAGTLVR